MQLFRRSKTDQSSEATSGRPLITPDEIMTLHPELQLLFVQALKPILALKNDFRKSPAARPGYSLAGLWKTRMSGIGKTAG